MRSFLSKTSTPGQDLPHAISILLLLLCYIVPTDSYLPTTVIPSIRGITSLYAAAQETVWQYKGHDVYTSVKTPSSGPPSNKPAALLIHGFGCSTTYWRETTNALLGDGYEVHSLDLLGQGKSAKPGRADDIEYSISLWADLVDSYAKENIVQDDVILVGNSLGSLVALSAATGDFNDDGGGGEDATWLKKRVRGICMFNCGVGLNSRGVAKEPRLTPTQSFLINNLYSVLCFFIFNNRLLLSYVLNKVVTKELLRNTLQSLYLHNPDRVDDELVDSFYLPAQDEGSVEALSQIFCNDPGETPFALHEKYSDFLSNLPIQLIWGDKDLITPIEGGVGQLYLGLADKKDSRVSFQLVESGHVPFDDNVECNNIMLTWLNDIVTDTA